jgi:hypothetical protein
MAFFQKKAPEEILKEMRSCLEVLAGYPARAPTLRTLNELLRDARALAKRVRRQLKKTAKYNQKAAKGMIAPLLLIEHTDEERYARLRPLAADALVFLEEIENSLKGIRAQKAAAEAQRKLRRGPIGMYRRMMTVEEYKRLRQTGVLEWAEIGEFIPAFKAPAFLVDKFLTYYDKTAVRNIYSHVGGTGSVDYVVFFSTDIVPAEIGPSRRWPEIFEVKFPHGTPVKILQVRRV